MGFRGLGFSDFRVQGFRALGNEDLRCRLCFNADSVSGAELSWPNPLSGFVEPGTLSRKLRECQALVHDGFKPKLM